MDSQRKEYLTTAVRVLPRGVCPEPLSSPRFRQAGGKYTGGER